MVASTEPPDSPVADLPSIEDAGAFIGGAGTVGVVSLLAAGYRALFSSSAEDREWLRSEVDALRSDMRTVQADLRTCQAEKEEFRARDQLRQAELAELRAQVQRGA